MPEGFRLGLTGPGRALPADTRRAMESIFQARFSDVRIHVGAEAASIGAHAFTVGSRIYFAPGRYEPSTAHGRRLLGHELAHVVQQRAGRVRNPYGDGLVVVRDPGLEAEADRMGLRAAAVPPLPPASPTHPVGTIQRMESNWDQARNYLEPVSGHSGSGFRVEAMDVDIRGSRDYSTSRTEQVLGEISTQLYYAMKDGDEEVTEVEAMSAGASLFLATNLRSAAVDLWERLYLSSRSQLESSMTGTYGREKNERETTGRIGSKLAGLESGTRDIEVAREIFSGLLLDRPEEVQYVDLTDGYGLDVVSAFLSNDLRGVFVVTGPDKRHAEVKLVKVLEAVGYSGGATIQGKKRACYTCASYMRVRNSQGYNLTFSDNPGFLWKDEFDRSEPEVQREVVRVLQLMESHKTGGSRGERYRSPSRSPERY